MVTRLDVLSGAGPTTRGARDDYPPEVDLPPMRVGLVNMPLSSCRGPSIQLGLLQAIAKEHGVDAECHYLNMAFAARIGWDLAERLCVHSSSFLLGDWFFSGAAFGERAPDVQRYEETFPGHLDSVAARIGVEKGELMAIRERHAAAFLDECVESVAWGEYDAVGFTSVFRQNCAALALARRIKEAWPEVAIVFGGANYEGELGRGFVQGIPWIDYAVCGEGDVAFVRLLESLARGERSPRIPGVAHAEGTDVVFPGPAASVRSLDALPAPDYDDYFRAAEDHGLPDVVLGCEVVLPIETARGCWWGAKHQCTFCGIYDESGMAYRSKSPARVLSDVRTLTSRYGIRSFAATDLILDPRYIEGVFGAFAAEHDDYRFFYELKSNIRPEQLRTLRRGGLINAQPGIESLNTHVLRLMDKGVTGIQNVRLLKWATYYGVDLSWHLLRGFPGERPEDYEQQIETIDLIGHLNPPDRRSVRIFLEKFSPNYDRAEELGFHNVRPCRSYACVYPEGLDLARIARTFDYDRASEIPNALVERLDESVERWHDAWHAERPRLEYRRGPDEIVIIDQRWRHEPSIRSLRGAAALVFEACTVTYHEARAVHRLLRDHGGIDVERAWVEDTLDALTEEGLMLREDGRYLGLALPINPHW